MTDEASPEMSPAPALAGEEARAYMRLWAQSLAQVLGQISGSPVAVDCLAEVPAEAPAHGETDLQFLVAADGGLQGEMALRIPLAVALAGGYARKLEDTVAIHVNTILAARNAAQLSSVSSPTL